MSADMGSRIAVLEDRSKREQKEREEIKAELKMIKVKVYEVASSFKTVKWLMVAVIIPLIGILVPYLLQ